MKAMLIHPNDSVAVALCPLHSGDGIIINNTRINILNTVDTGAKIAIKAMRSGDVIIKYGASIGHLTQNVKQGEWVHIHNLKTALNELQEYHYTPNFANVTTPCKARKINIYKRENGDMGIRNELWILPAVGCVNATAQAIARLFSEKNKLDDIDGVYVFTHPYGCSQLGIDHENTRRILANMTLHPNAGGVLVIGLGCENNQMASFQGMLGKINTRRIKFMQAQQEKNEIVAGCQYLDDIYQEMRNDRRQLTSIANLRVGLECGGSDGLSGITANPLLGRFSDYLILQGGSCVLTEVPEMFGAEQLLFSRCADENVFHQAVAMINNFKNYFIRHGQAIYENPSPGNKQGGISTLEEKSLGCTQKAGASKIVSVLEYGQRIRQKGLSLLSAPGNDAVATSALAAAGCHMVLFSTGRGTPYGGFVPTVKISSNSYLAKNKPHWIDFNAGVLLEEANADSVLEDFIDLIVSIADGQLTRNEMNQFRELAIFKNGVTL